MKIRQHLETNEKLIDQNKIEEALERSNLKVIANLSDKENTIIGDGGGFQVDKIKGLL